MVARPKKERKTIEIGGFKKLGNVSRFSRPGHHTLIKEDSLRAAYEKFDVKNKGSITVEDLELAFGSKKHAREVFALVDANGDGEISFEEFREMMGLSPTELQGGGTTPGVPSSAAPRHRAQSAHARIKEHAAHERRKSLEALSPPRAPPLDPIAASPEPPRPPLLAKAGTPAWTSSGELKDEDPRDPPKPP